jgi:hypothetical protein
MLQFQLRDRIVPLQLTLQRYRIANLRDAGNPHNATALCDHQHMTSVQRHRPCHNAPYNQPSHKGAKANSDQVRSVALQLMNGIINGSTLTHRSAVYALVMQACRQYSESLECLVHTVASSFYLAA